MRLHGDHHKGLLPPLPSVWLFHGRSVVARVFLIGSRLPLDITVQLLTTSFQDLYHINL